MVRIMDNTMDTPQIQGLHGANAESVEPDAVDLRPRWAQRLYPVVEYISTAGGSKLLRDIGM
jgi:hypothetical protein